MRRYDHLQQQPPPPQGYTDDVEDQAYAGRRQSRALPSPPPQYQSPPHSPRAGLNPASHPNSAFSRLRAERRYSRERGQEPFRAIAIDQNTATYDSPEEEIPPSPVHRDSDGRYWGQRIGYVPTTSSIHSNVTPGADNYSERAAGGLAGIAMGVADAQPRESGLEAMRNTPGLAGVDGGYSLQDPHEAHFYDGRGPAPYTDAPGPSSPYVQPTYHHDVSQSSLTPIGAAAFPPGAATPTARSAASHTPPSFSEPFTDTPYNRYSRSLEPMMTGIDPNSIEDDGDDGLEYSQANQRGSILNLRNNNHSDPGTGSAVAGGAAAGGLLGGFLGKNNSGAHASQYDPVTGHAANAGYAGSGGSGGPGGPGAYSMGGPGEKSEWLTKQSHGSKKMKWIVGLVLAFLIIGGIVGGVVGGILSRKHSSNSSSSSSSADSQGDSSGGSSGGSSGSSSSGDSDSSDLNKNSAEIKKLLNNPDLHKVFPGIDYTPMNAQYPDCIKSPPDQNNVTRDLAVLSQLSNNIRLYGTDCNQTEMLLHSIDQLGLNGTIKVWLGVWLDNNATTNQRQLDQMYDVLDKYGAASFKGVIVGNEVLFREDMTAAQLGTVIQGVRTNLTSRGIKIPVASSDLGDNWTSELASLVDIVMANIHPFFAGVTAETAAGWTWDFWQQHDVPLASSLSNNVISETGWPSAGGTDCGGAETCTVGSVAGIDEMNTFMNDWVCQSLKNGTEYFWFEAFDEPWKIVYDTPGKEWEDKWGLMDVNRNLKKGVVIPDCGGQEAS
ncbi:glycoside hydrolase superfamily [Xylogone sp. PMI_703]|nr:glycoside hydrolase superfamily [Xylogone sp. PMI_703]